MTWKVEFDDRAKKELHKLDKKTQILILQFLRTRIATDQDPKRFGKNLSYHYSGLWRYRIGKYRIVCCIKSNTLSVLVLRIAHRQSVYS